MSPGSREPCDNYPDTGGLPVPLRRSTQRSSGSQHRFSRGRRSTDVHERLCSSRGGRTQSNWVGSRSRAENEDDRRKLLLVREEAPSTCRPEWADPGVPGLRRTGEIRRARHAPRALARATAGTGCRRTDARWRETESSASKDDAHAIPGIGPRTGPASATGSPSIVHRLTADRPGRPARGRCRRGRDCVPQGRVVGCGARRSAG